MRTFILLVAALPACAQFRDLASTDDGAHLYFVTDLRLRSEAPLDLPNTSAVYRWTAAGLERITEPSQHGISLFRPYQENPRISGAGDVFVYTVTRPCYGGSGCISNPTTRESVLYLGAQRQGETLGGTTQISRNSRYALSFGRWSTFLQKTEYRDLRDFQTGAKVQVEVWPSSQRQALTSDGRVLGTDLNDPRKLVLWSAAGRRELPIQLPELTGPAILDDRAGWVIYEATEGTQPVVSLRAYRVSGGGDVLLAERAGPATFQASISNDGGTVLYVAPGDEDQPDQAWLVGPDGTNRRQLTALEEGVSTAILAGHGTVAFAVTNRGRLVRIDTATGAIEELIAETPSYYPGFTTLIPGSMLPIRGSGLAASTRWAPGFPLPTEIDGVRVLANGAPLPLLSVSPVEIWFQLPFETQLTDSVHVELENQSAFDGGSVTTQVVRRHPYFFDSVAHQDFSGLVTVQAPVSAGEIVHVWGVGLGGVAPDMPTGQLTPVGPLYRLVDPLECRIRDQPLEVLFAGLAPALIGIYQVDVRLPGSLPDQVALLQCGTPGVEEESHGVFLYTPRTPEPARAKMPVTR
jgi:uncharacterized protein (TIGR03437 family)